MNPPDGNSGDTKRALTEEYRRHQKSLNESFLQFFQQQADQECVQKPSALDYEFYSWSLASRFGHNISGTSIMSFGTGDCGQLGFGISDPPKDKETTMPLAKEIATFKSHKEMRIIKAGGLSNGVVDAQGLWTWGCNDGGALGREGDENLPLLVSFPFKVIVVSLSLGDGHGAAVALNGQGFLWGSYRDKEGKMWFPPSKGQKLTGPDTQSLFPVLVPDLCDLRQVNSGANHTMFLNGKGQVFSCGLGEQHQLGRNVSPALRDQEGEYLLNVISDHLQAKPVLLDFFCVTLGCGQYHTLFVNQDFSVFGCGLNQYRQVCPLEESVISKVTHIKALDGKEVCEVGGGEHFSLARSKRQGIFTWGRSDQNQLGRLSQNKEAGASESEPKLVSSLPRTIAQVCCGTSHVICSTDKGEVYTWGFGETYQLGHGEAEDEPLPKLVQSLKGKRVIQVSAGGQHCCVMLG